MEHVEGRRCTLVQGLINDLRDIVDTIVETEKELGPNSTPLEYIEEAELLGFKIREHINNSPAHGVVG